MNECRELRGGRMGIESLLVQSNCEMTGHDAQIITMTGLKRPYQDISPAQCTPTPKKSRSFWATVMENATGTNEKHEEIKSTESRSLRFGQEPSQNVFSNRVDFDTAHVLSSLRFKSEPAELSIPGIASRREVLGSPLSVVTDSDQSPPLCQPDAENSKLAVDPEETKNGVTGETQWDLVKTKAHACHDCGSSFARSSHLRLHVGTVHEMKKPYRCDEPSCGALFGHVSSKYRHYRTVHLKRRDFQCTQCGLSFGEKSGLRKHELSVHIGSRPHQCDQCGFRFSFRLHLQQHIATVHEKRRPFSCDVCGHTFGQRSSLNRHMRQICRKDSR
jgi:rubredoxin